MNAKQLVYLMVLMTCPLYAMHKSHKAYTYDECQEQQTWISELQMEYQKKYRNPFGREVKKMKKMWKLIPLETQEKIITLINNQKIVAPKYLLKGDKLSITDAALTKKYNQYMSLYPYSDNLMRISINNKAVSLAHEELTSTNMAKLLVLLQLRTIDQQVSGGTKLTKITDWMIKNYIEDTALQSAQALDEKPE